MTLKGTCRRLPIAPLRTIAIAIHVVPTNMMGIASRQLSPTASIDPAVCRVERFIRSVLQYARIVHSDQVRIGTGTGSMSGLVRTPSGAMALGCLGSSHASIDVIRRLASCIFMPLILTLKLFESSRRPKMPSPSQYSNEVVVKHGLLRKSRCANNLVGAQLQNNKPL